MRERRACEQESSFKGETERECVGDTRAASSPPPSSFHFLPLSLSSLHYPSHQLQLSQAVKHWEHDVLLHRSAGPNLLGDSQQHVRDLILKLLRGRQPCPEVRRELLEGCERLGEVDRLFAGAGPGCGGGLGLRAWGVRGSLRVEERETGRQRV
jgi:hypothetical protein